MALTILPYLSPRLIIVDAPATEITIQDLVDQLRDWEDNPELGMTYEQILSAAGKENLGGGVSVGITATLLNAQLAFEERNTPVETGTATSNDTAGLVLTDTAATFVSNGVTVGATVLNTTTGASATVSEITSETQLTTLGLSDGSRNDFQIGDAYLVFNVIQCNVSGGNLVAIDDLGADLDPIFPTAYTQVIRTSSSSATLQDLNSIQISSFGGGVAIDTTSSYSGTAFPTGTRQQPVNNMTDALSIAQSRGLSVFFVIGSLTLTSNDYSNGYVFHGDNPVSSVLTINAGANVANCEFTNLTISGELDNNNILRECSVGALTQINGFIYRCAFSDTITLGAGAEAIIMSCYSQIPGGGPAQYPTIDLGGAGQQLALRDYYGGIEITNGTGADDHSIDMSSGRVIVDSTCTGGTLTIRGLSKVTDNSVGMTVDDQTIPQEVWDTVIDGSLTAQESMRVQNSALFGKLSGAATTNVLIRDVSDTKNRINATVDSDGNRSAVTVDGS